MQRSKLPYFFLGLAAVISAVAVMLLIVRPGGQGKVKELNEVWRPLGISVRDLVNVERSRGYYGVLVINVADNGLAKSRLMPGDLILRVNNSRVGDADTFARDLTASAAVQDTVLNVARGGRVIRVDIPTLPRGQ